MRVQSMKDDDLIPAETQVSVCHRGFSARHRLLPRIAPGRGVPASSRAVR